VNTSTRRPAGCHPCTPINEALVRDLATGAFLANQRNVVLVGGTGSGKTHLSIAIARSCIRTGARVRFHDTTDLVNRLKMEALQARAGGLRFEAYLPEPLADWLLERIERGMFTDPSEAVFAITTNFHDLEPHRDLREELLRRKLQAAIDDPRPVIPLEQVMAEMRSRLAEPRPESARWRKIVRCAAGVDQADGTVPIRSCAIQSWTLRAALANRSSSGPEARFAVQ
jgi:hypothetical protein